VGRIWLDGQRRDTDRHATIRFRCVPADGTPAHPFTWPHRMRWEVPRLNGPPPHCAACAAAERPGFGDHIGYRFDFAYREAAAGLILIGQGMSFRKASAQLRKQARRWQGGLTMVTSGEAQLTQSYVDAFAPLVLGELASTRWPEVVAIDSKPLKRKRIVGGKRATGGDEAGEIMVAVEHPIYANLRPRPLLIQVQGGKDRVSWAKFLTSLRGRPEWIVTDGDNGLDAAIRDLGWDKQGTIVYRCEAHLRMNAEQAAFEDGLLEWQPSKRVNHADELLTLRRLLTPRKGRQRAWDRTSLFLALRQAVESPEQWARFERLVRRHVPPKKKALRAWMRGVRPILREQWEIKETVGMVRPHSTGAVENTIVTVGDALLGRAVQFGNRRRLDKVLGLMALEIGGDSDAKRYEELIREHFDQHAQHRSGVAWGDFFDKGVSSLDRMIVEAKVGQAQATHLLTTLPKAAARVQQWKATRQARGLKGRGLRADGGSRYYPVPAGTTVADVPEIGKQWHPVRNGGVDPASVPAARKTKAWWQCEVDPSHEWEALIVGRCTRRTACPFCTGKRVGADNNLAVKFPEVAAEWHPTKNAPLRPSDVLPVSAKDAWWICPDGHEYRRKIGHRTKQGLGCQDPTHKPPRKSSAQYADTKNRRSRASRRLVNAGEELLAGNLDVTGLPQRALDTLALNAARDHLVRLQAMLGVEMLAALLDRSLGTVRQYNVHPPSLLVARRLAYLVELADALGKHVDLKDWLERPQSRLGGQSPAALLLRTGNWDPVHAGPGTLMAMAKQTT
jgi:hypothetical protein